MTDKLDQLLVSGDQPEFLHKQLGKLRGLVISMAKFGPEEEKFDQVKKIVTEVLTRGNRALRKFTKAYDGVDLAPSEFRVSKKDLDKAHREIKRNSPKLFKTIRQAIKNVRRYQKETFVGTDKKCSGGTGIKYTPIERAGICVPGASAPLPSTVIMCAVPAQVAGVEEIVVVSPPRYNKSIHPTTLAVCRELGIDEVYRIGGAQAVAALAYGTSKILRVDKIVGPGNKWVQTAKQLVLGHVGIDSIAGPSEVFVIANDKANPAWVAADMLSQVEHTPGNAAVFTDSQVFAKSVLNELRKQVEQLNRREETIKYLKKFSKIIVFKNMGEAIKWANCLAPEHLQIQCGGESRKIAKWITRAGAIFIGDYSPVAVGDYWAGPSHTLPTGMAARFSSALIANDFIKSTSIIEYSKKQLAESAEDIIRLAEAEGLDAHAKSVRIRQEK